MQEGYSFALQGLSYCYPIVEILLASVLDTLINH